jgi:hypothetical protein
MSNESAKRERLISERMSWLTSGLFLLLCLSATSAFAATSVGQGQRYRANPAPGKEAAFELNSEFAPLLQSHPPATPNSISRGAFETLSLQKWQVCSIGLGPIWTMSSVFSDDALTATQFLAGDEAFGIGEVTPVAESATWVMAALVIGWLVWSRWNRLRHLYAQTLSALTKCLSRPGFGPLPVP